MGWNYITTLKTDVGSECKLPKVLREHFKAKHDIELPADFGPYGDIVFPDADSRLNLFRSPSQETGALIVVENLSGSRSSAEFYVYGDLVRLCKRCNDIHRETNYYYCPKCGSKLTHELW